MPSRPNAPLVAIRPVELQDIEQLRQWRNDLRINYLFRHRKHISREEQDAWYDRVSAPDSQDRMYAITADDGLIGCCGLCHIGSGCAEASLYVAHDMFGPEAVVALIMLTAEAPAHGVNTLWTECIKNSKPRLNFWKYGGFEVYDENPGSTFLQRSVYATAA